MRQILSLNTQQQLQLTPLLKQSIKFLQLSTQELTQEIRTLLTTNLFLETIDEINESEEVDIDGSVDDAERTDFNEESVIADLSFEEKNSVDVIRSPGKANDLTYDKCQSSSESLQMHLKWQLDTIPLTDRDKTIGAVILDAINDNGFLEANNAELQAGVKASGYSVEESEIQRMVHVVQSFEPTGVGARTAGEALELQLNAMPINTPGRKLALLLVSEALTFLAKRQYSALQKHYQVSVKQLEKAVNLILTLNPHPGNVNYADHATNFVIPDVRVYKNSKKHWEVILIENTLPHLQLNSSYLYWAETASPSSSQALVQKHLQEARWLMKCVKNRNETLLKAARCIMKYQGDFLEYGAGAMKPLVLRTVAEELNMHTSTISRVTTHKYIQTPQGIFELKYFFSSHLTTSYGSSISASAIQTFINDIIKQEADKKPLSDQEITHQLKAQGIMISRRTVTKYRIKLGIPSMEQRKHLG